MAVETWDPGGESAGLTPARLALLLKAARRLSEPRFGLDAETAGELAPVVRHSGGSRRGVDWSQAGAELSDDDLLQLIRLFTLAESALPGWEAGDASPVIPLAATLEGPRQLSCRPHRLDPRP